jgi:hypothetical protein
LVLFVPSVERDGETKVDQSRWVRQALEMFGVTFGGATAFPRGLGVWRDDARGATLVWDEPVIVHCYVSPTQASNPKLLRSVASFCRHMGRETNQGAVGLVIGDDYQQFEF